MIFGYQLIINFQSNRYQLQKQALSKILASISQYFSINYLIDYLSASLEIRCHLLSIFVCIVEPVESITFARWYPVEGVLLITFGKEVGRCEAAVKINSEVKEVQWKMVGGTHSAHVWVSIFSKIT